MKWLVKMKRHEQKTCSDFINFSLSFFRTASKLHMFSRINGTSKDFFPLLPSIFHRNISSRGCCSLLNRRLVFSKVWQDTGGSEEAHLVKPTSLTVPITKTQQERTEAPGSTFPFFLKRPTERSANMLRDSWSFPSRDTGFRVTLSTAALQVLFALVPSDLFQRHSHQCELWGPVCAAARHIPYSLVLKQIPDIISSDIFLCF